MKLLPRRRGPSQFQRAAEGSMTVTEHLMELRSRLFKASLAVAAGMVVGYVLAQPVFAILQQPYCNLELAGPGEQCQPLQQLEPLAAFMLKLKLALWIGLILAAPAWFYQLWAFIAPGLHRSERWWAYTFVSVAVPLFVAGAVLAYFVVERGLHFLLGEGIAGLDVQLEVTNYVSFITTVMLVFAVAFEFPLLVLMLNFAGIVSARKLLSFWRVAIFLFTLFAAITTPDPGPFGMILLAACLSLMYFVAVGVAFLNDRRRARKHKDRYGDVADDEISPMDDDISSLDDEEWEPATAGQPGEAIIPVTELAAPSRRYDDMT